MIASFYRWLCTAYLVIIELHIEKILELFPAQKRKTVTGRMAVAE
jgi:hypothetical protein